MKPLCVICLGFVALLAAFSSGEDAFEIRGNADDGLVEKQGCEDYQRGDQWGTTDHDNCICLAPDRLCYHVDCLPGSEIARDSNDLWKCKYVSSRRDNTGSGVAVQDRVKRVTPIDAFGAFSGVVGIVGFIMDRIESAQTTAQLNEIQDQIRELDWKVNELTRRVSDLHLGQEYLRQTALYGRDELRLRNMLDTHAKMQISNGQYVLPGYNIQAWADSVLSYGSDGIQQVLYNLLDMVNQQSVIFGGKSIFEVYHLRLINGYNKRYTEKMKNKYEQIYGLIGGGYSVWITALRIKGRTSEISAKKNETERELYTVKLSVAKYLEPKNWRADLRCGRGYPADNGQPAQCHPDSRYPCCSPNKFCGNSAAHCDCWNCVNYRYRSWRDDWRCGNGYPAQNGRPAICHPDSNGPCCSPNSWCGGGRDHCDCRGCVDYRPKIKTPVMETMPEGWDWGRYFSSFG